MIVNFMFQYIQAMVIRYLIKHWCVEPWLIQSFYYQKYFCSSNGILNWYSSKIYVLEGRETIFLITVFGKILSYIGWKVRTYNKVAKSDGQMTLNDTQFVLEREREHAKKERDKEKEKKEREESHRKNGRRLANMVPSFIYCGLEEVMYQVPNHVQKDGKVVEVWGCSRYAQA